MAVIHFNQEGFDKAVPAAPIAMVDFWADWCGPCKMLAPTIDKIADEFEGKALVDGRSTLHFVVEVKNANQLYEVIERIGKLPNIVEAVRDSEDADTTVADAKA